MKISELIAVLQHEMETHGDLVIVKQPNDNPEAWWLDEARPGFSHPVGKNDDTPYLKDRIIVECYDHTRPTHLEMHI